MKFQSFYNEYIPYFRKEYKNCVRNDAPKSLYGPIRYTLEHCGKQIRPAILAASASSLNDVTIERTFSAASCVEMIHNFTLVHDDIMDGDLLRHGMQTVHAKWDVNKAILSGDGLFAIALKQLDPYKSDAGLYASIMPVLLEAVVKVCEGQALDLDFEVRNNVTLNEYLEMVEKKTAYLLSVSAKIGAIIAGSNTYEITLVEKIIRELGIVFQIQDDLLELTSDSQNMGKTLGSDIVKQKKTFPYLFAKENLSAEKWIEFQEASSAEIIEKEGINPLRQLLENNFIFDRIHELIKLRHVTIHELIKALPERSHEMFNSMVEFIMNRKN